MSVGTYSGTPIEASQSDRATGITRALGPGCAGSSGRSLSPGALRAHRLGSTLFATGITPRARPCLGSCSIHHLASAARPRRSADRGRPSALLSRWFWPGSVLLSRTVLYRGLLPDSLRSPRAGPRAGFLGPVSHRCCHKPAPPRRAASCGDVRALDGRSPGGGILDGLEPEERRTRWAGDLPSGHTGMRAQ